MEPTDPSTGLTLLRASRLEALVQPLQLLLAQTRPDDPLAPQTLIAAHPGMRHWLTGALARAVGPGRIVANLDVLLPSTWLDRLSSALLGERAVALPHYRRGHLRWTLHGLLGDAGGHGVDDPRVLAYLAAGAGADERALRRFQLADRLARVYSQYLVYRSDWLAAWEAGKAPFATAGQADAPLRSLESAFLAPLWRATAARLGEHRGRLVEALVARLAVPDPALPPLHVFGLAHLPPGELAVLQAYGRSAPVFVYVPDPCREYWGGLHAAAADGPWRRPDPAAWREFRRAEQARLDDPDALDWRDQGHPLLARWGRLGQHFLAALVEGEVREDIRHGLDETAAAPGDRLQRLQESVRQLQPALLREDAAAPAAAADASLRVHACHTRQRELEVLRDALLDAIAHEGLAPGDIVVMAPDIQAYLPLIPAVFGEPGSARERLLPYHLADVPVARSHPLFVAFRDLLGLGGARLTAPEVVDLLGVAEVRRALALDAADADLLVEWLRASRVAWALDGRHKAALGLPAQAAHSFAWALDRMIAGYLMADAGDDADPPAATLPDGTALLPLAGPEGPSAAALGKLDRLLGELQAWRDLADAERPAGAWAAELRTRVDALLRADPADADARAALSALHRAIAQVGAEPAHNGEDPPLRLAVVRELLDDALAGAPERQRFLMGGITFCGMVPQRAIPFAMVCVLGLDEGAFPRRPADGGIDLMARLRRLGDRDVPGDDRYLFLETLMSARRRLHLSFTGQGVRDGRHRNPAAPLAELLAELDLRAGLAPDDPAATRPWLVRHPLQPFDGRYFDGSQPALFSYSAAFAGMQGGGRAPLPSLRDGGLPRAEAAPEVVPLAALEGWFRDPARALLRDHLQLSLDALDDAAELPEDEPLDGIARIDAVARRVFMRSVLPRQCAEPAWQWDGAAPDWIRHGGLLPPGEVGDAAWQAEVAAVRALAQRARALERFDARAGAGALAVPVEVPLQEPAGAGDQGTVPRRIVGTLRNVFPLRGSPDGVQLVVACPNPGDADTGLKKPGDLGFRELVPAFLHWALLRLHGAGEDPPGPVRLTVLAQDEPDLAARVNAWDAQYCAADEARRAALADGLRGRLRGLVRLWQDGCAGRSRFHPRAAWTALARKPSGSDDETRWLQAAAAAVAATWAGSGTGGTGERDHAPGYARLLEGELVFGDPDSDPGNEALRALLREARQLAALIMLADDGEAAAGPHGDAP